MNKENRLLLFQETQNVRVGKDVTITIRIVALKMDVALS